MAEEIKNENTEAEPEKEVKEEVKKEKKSKKDIAELESKVDKLNDEKADLLQENAILKYENMMLTPRKGDAEDVGNSLSASAV